MPNKIFHYPSKLDMFLDPDLLTALRINLMLQELTENEEHYERCELEDMKLQDYVDEILIRAYLFTLGMEQQYDEAIKPPTPDHILAVFGKMEGFSLHDKFSSLLQTMGGDCALELAVTYFEDICTIADQLADRDRLDVLAEEQEWSHFLPRTFLDDDIFSPFGLYGE